MFESGMSAAGVVIDPLMGAVAGVVDALDGVAAVSVWQAGDGELLEGLSGLTVAAAQLEAQRLRLVQEVQVRGCASTRGGVTAAGWLRSVLGVRPSSASRQVALAEALHVRYGRTREALEAGRVSADVAQVIVHALDALPADLVAGARERAETFLLEQAGLLDPAALTRVGRHLLAVIDPGAGEKADRAEERAVRGRELQLGTDQWDGMLSLRGRLDPEAGIALRAALEAFSAPQPGTEGTADVRTPAQRRADALTALVAGVLDGGGLPTSGGQRPHINVTVPLDTLVDRLGGPARTGGHGPAAGGGGSDPRGSGAGSASGAGWGQGTGARLPESEWGVTLSPEAARRLACDGQIIPIVLGGAGQPLDVGRSAYVVPAAMRRALIVRDRGCAFPGCDRPPGWCHAHHIRHWADGGDTAIDNLVLLCGHHHRLMHHSGWQVRIGERGMPLFVPPPWIDPAQTPRQSDWRNQLEDFAAHGHDPPDEAAAA